MLNEASHNIEFFSKDKKDLDRKIDLIHADIQKSKKAIYDISTKLKKINAEISIITAYIEAREKAYNEAREKAYKLASEMTYFDSLINSIKESSQTSEADPLVNPGRKGHDKSSSANLSQNIEIIPIKGVKGVFSDEGLKRTYKMIKGYEEDIKQQEGIMTKNNWHGKEPNKSDYFDELQRQHRDLQEDLRSASAKLRADEQKLAELETYRERLKDIVRSLEEMAAIEEQQSQQHPKPTQSQARKPRI